MAINRHKNRIKYTISFVFMSANLWLLHTTHHHLYPPPLNTKSHTIIPRHEFNHCPTSQTHGISLCLTSEWKLKEYIPLDGLGLGQATYEDKTNQTNKLTISSTRQWQHQQINTYNQLHQYILSQFTSVGISRIVPFTGEFSFPKDATVLAALVQESPISYHLFLSNKQFVHHIILETQNGSQQAQQQFENILSTLELHSAHTQTQYSPQNPIQVTCTSQNTCTLQYLAPPDQKTSTIYFHILQNEQIVESIKPKFDSNINQFIATWQPETPIDNTNLNSYSVSLEFLTTEEDMLVTHSAIPLALSNNN